MDFGLDSGEAPGARASGLPSRGVAMLRVAGVR